MNAHLIDFMFWSAGLFLLGTLCGMSIVWKRYRNAIEDRDAQAKREAEKVSGFMTKGVEFNQQILDILTKYGSLDYAMARASEYAQNAREALDDFPDSEIKRALLWAPEFVIAREK